MGSQLLVFTNDLLDYIVMICLSLKDKQTAANKFKDDSHKNSSFIFIAQHGRGDPSHWGPLTVNSAIESNVQVNRLTQLPLRAAPKREIRSNLHNSHIKNVSFNFYYFLSTFFKFTLNKKFVLITNYYVNK